MWWLIALRGLRRGEAAGLRWADVDLDLRVITIEQQRIAFGHTVTVGPPKTAAGRRVIALDHTTVRLLRDHQIRQRAEHADLGAVPECVFTTPDGAALHPDWLTRRFRRLVTESGLPPIRLHDLRHGAATLAHTTGADLIGVDIGRACYAGTLRVNSATPVTAYDSPWCTDLPN